MLFSVVVLFFFLGSQVVSSPSCPSKNFNLVFIFDESGSVGRSIYEDFQQPFVKSLLQDTYYNVDPVGTYVGVIKSSTESVPGNNSYCSPEEVSDLLIVHEIDGDESTVVAQVEMTNPDMAWRGRYTPSGHALEAARNMIVALGDTRYKEYVSFVIFFTDGRPTCDTHGAENLEDATFALHVAGQLRKMSPAIVVFIVQVGFDQNDGTNRGTAYFDMLYNPYIYTVPADLENPDPTPYIQTIVNETCNFDIYCSPACGENYDCKLPNYCTCKDGYEMPGCTPVCAVGCDPVHGSCTVPDDCDCDADTLAPLCTEPKCAVGCDPTHGSCDDPWNPHGCVCEDGWELPLCDTATCDPLCTGNTYCSAPGSPGTCSCDPGWTNAPVCDTAVCAVGCDHGVCPGSPGTCTCDPIDEWDGDLCDVALCTPGCDHGGCDGAPLTCTCDPIDEWKGDLCDTAICLTGCVNGTCDGSPGTCVCNDGWKGGLCHVAICSVGCNDIHGDCTVPDTCECEDGWEIPLCDDPICLDGCVNGYCNNPGECICDDGWDPTAPLCNVATCLDGCLHGTCDLPDECICEDGWSEEKCNVPVCRTGCDHGYCDDPGECICLDGYYGNWCNDSSVTCLDGCVHGGCTLPDTCVCLAGWMNSLCDKAICSATCVNGNCEVPGECICYPGWKGDDCDSPVCTVGCSVLYGSCTEPFTCVCDDGWDGNLCDEAECKTGCFGGFCIDAGECICLSGWDGELCDTPLCSPPCVKNAACINPDVCQCLDGFVGEGDSVCEDYVPTCLVDNSHICVVEEVPTCCCDDGYYGEDALSGCDPVCDVVDIDLSCSGDNGTCISPGVCECDLGYFGEQCEKWKCFDYEYVDSQCCNFGNGTCVSPHQCMCSDYYEGENCEYLKTTPDSVADYLVTIIVSAASGSLVIFSLVVMVLSLLFLSCQLRRSSQSSGKRMRLAQIGMHDKKLLKDLDDSDDSESETPETETEGKEDLEDSGDECTPETHETETE